MKTTFKYKLICLVIICFIGKTALSQSTTKWTEQSARKWVEAGTWRHGLKQKLYPGINYVEFARQYNLNKALWDKAFAYIQNTDLNAVAPGKYPIDGENVFVTITDNVPREFDKSIWESHRKYLDIHLMVRGREKIGVMNPATAKVTDPYDKVADLAHYSADTKGTYYIADKNTFFMFFPVNSHRPTIKVDGNDKVKKLVIKIRMAQ